MRLLTTHCQLEGFPVKPLKINKIMNLTRHFLALNCILLTLLAANAKAGKLNGNYSIHAGELISLWDVSGNYSNSFSVGAFTYTLSEDLSGQIVGVGTFYLGEDYLGVPTGLYGVVTNTGSISGISTNPTVDLGLAVTGTGEALGITVFNFTEVLNLQLSINGISGTMNGSGTDIFTQVPIFSGRDEIIRSASQPVTGVQIQLPGNATGDWQLGLNVAPQKNNKYSGTATITTPNGNHQNMNVAGSYSLPNGVSTLNLTGKGGNLTLTLAASGNQSTVKTMKGKLFGQSVNYKSK